MVQERITTSDPRFGEAGTSDEDLRRALLAALRRMNRAQQNTSVILSLDVDGVADVPGVHVARVRETLGDLKLDGLTEPYVETMGHGLAEGACRLTTAGAAGLRMLEQQRAQFASPGEVASDEEYDVFISHASEDKEAVARPIPDRLRAAGLRVWFDGFSLKLGDSLRRSIERGLARSRFGIVIVSPQFLSKEWPQAELNGLSLVRSAA